jgi:hypothetical protein
MTAMACAAIDNLCNADLYNKGSGKGSPPQAWSGPQQMAAASISVHPATVVHEHIIIGSAGFWTHLSADDAVLRSHFFVKVAPSQW